MDDNIVTKRPLLLYCMGGLSKLKRTLYERHFLQTILSDELLLMHLPEASHQLKDLNNAEYIQLHINLRHFSTFAFN